VVLPSGLTADDIVAIHDATQHRVAALVHPKGAPKHKASDDAEAVALPAGLKTVERLPGQIGGPWGRFTQGVAKLVEVRAAIDKAAAETEGEREDEQAQANTEADEVWRAVEGWLGGWRHVLDDGQTPRAADAQWLYAQLFPKPLGLKFITARPSRQWSLMKPKMALLATERGQEILRGFGGERIYRQLVAAHERFGRAYGFRAVLGEEEAVVTDSRPELQVCKDCLREFLLKVESFAEPTEPGSEALSAFLLRPYLDVADELASTPSGRKPGGAPPSPVTP
jgi:hypothetical protein